MTNELPQARIDEIIAFFAEYTAAQAELQYAQRFPRVPIEGPDQGHDRRLESAQTRFDEVLAKLPSREQAEAAALVELQGLGAEYYRLKAAFKQAVQAELAAVQARDAAAQTEEYRQRFAILGLEEIKTRRAAFAAQEELNRVIYSRQVVENRLDQVHQRTGANPNPANFPAIAAARVDSLLGAHYTAGEVKDLKAKLGLTDEMLAQLAGTT